MAKSKQQKEKAIEALKPLDHDARVEVLTQEGFSEKERAEVLDALAEYDNAQEAEDVSAVAQLIGDNELLEQEELAEAPAPPAPAPAPAPAPVAEQPKMEKVEQPKAHTGHPRFEQVELYVSEGQLKEGSVIKIVNIEADRAERLNAQERNTKIRYRPIK